MLNAMKEYIIQRDNFIQKDVDELVQCGIPENFARVLSSRGITSSSLSELQGDGKYHDAFAMQGMSQAVQTVKKTAQEGKRILVYGDYDADGLSASSLLSLFFTRNGIDNDVVIPDRQDGYGMHTHLVSEMLSTGKYGLLITVDCGISDSDTVEELKQLFPDVDIVVTDHHEVPETIPQCVCVNPKLGNYPFRYLSGSGVAYKLVQAIAGNDIALQYADLAMIGTIADIMPLRDENRTIVRHGLSNFNHKGLKLLAAQSRCEKTITATDIAMRIAPRINAAGRVGSPLTALRVLLSAERADEDAVERLSELNEQRKQLLDDIVEQADALCDNRKIRQEKLVFLYGKGWQHGLLGIVANRFREKYNLPAVIMTEDNGNYVGSARGTDGVDLHALFVQAESLLVRFGGHKASVGFTVSAENLNALRQRLSQCLCAMPEEVFDRKLYYDLDADGSFTYADVLRLSDMLQPMLPSDGIVLRVQDHVKYANSFGKDGSHISFTVSDGLEMKGFFKFSQYLDALKTGAETVILCTLERSSYDGNIVGIVSAIDLLPSLHFEKLFDTVYAKNISVQPFDIHESAFEKVQEALKSNNVAVVFDTYNQYLKFGKEVCNELPAPKFFLPDQSDRCVLIAPINNDFSRYDNVVVFTDSKSVRNYGSALYVFVDRPQRPVLNRKICMAVYKALLGKGKYDSIQGLYNKFLLEKITYAQYLCTLKVFEQLHLISTDYMYQLEIKGNKVNLEDSAVYRYLYEDC